MQVPSQVFKLITAGRLIDGMGGPPIQDGAVLVQGDKIIAAGPVGEVVAPEGATVDTYDYPGKTVMPGMIDCHTHHNGFGDGRPGEDVAALPGFSRLHPLQPDDTCQGAIRLLVELSAYLT